MPRTFGEHLEYLLVFGQRYFDDVFAFGEHLAHAEFFAGLCQLILYSVTKLGDRFDTHQGRVALEGVNAALLLGPALGAFDKRIDEPLDAAPKLLKPIGVSSRELKEMHQLALIAFGS